jgi:hypothetical protein
MPRVTTFDSVAHRRHPSGTTALVRSLSIYMAHASRSSMRTVELGHLSLDDHP